MKCLATSRSDPRHPERRAVLDLDARHHPTPPAVQGAEDLDRHELLQRLRPVEDARRVAADDPDPAPAYLEPVRLGTARRIDAELDRTRADRAARREREARRTREVLAEELRNRLDLRCRDDTGALVQHMLAARRRQLRRPWDQGWLGRHQSV
jgi:hypothetical protein